MIHNLDASEEDVDIAKDEDEDDQRHANVVGSATGVNRHNSNPILLQNSRSAGGIRSQSYIAVAVRQQ